MIDFSKYTVVIQGPLHPNSVVALRSYALKFPVILSTWSDNTETEKQVTNMIGKGDHVAVVSYNLDDTEIYDEQSRYKQFLTAYRGVRLVDTEYVIKVRSDEYYTDFIPLLEKFEEDTEKLVSTNLFFRKFSYYMYHPSDHVYVAKTASLKNVLEECIKDCKLGSTAIFSKCKIAAKDGETLTPEQQLAINWVLEHTDIDLNSGDLNIDDHTEIMKENFDVVEVKDLGLYNVSFHGNFSFDYEKFYDRETDIKKIEDL
jgi:hypothetical protein